MRLVQSRAGLLDHCFASYARMQDLGVVPDSHTLNSLVGACARAGQTSRAQQVFDTLFPKHDIVPDVTAWNSMLGAFASAGDKVNLMTEMAPKSQAASQSMLFLSAEKLNKVNAVPKL